MADQTNNPKHRAVADLSDADFEQLSAYIDGELTDAERAQVEDAVRESPALRAKLGELLDLDDSLRSLAQAEDISDWANLVSRSPIGPTPAAAAAAAGAGERRSVSLPWAFAMAACCLVAITFGTITLMTSGSDDVPEQYPVVTLTVTNSGSADGTGVTPTRVVAVALTPRPVAVSLGSGSRIEGSEPLMRVASNDMTEAARVRVRLQGHEGSEPIEIELDSDVAIFESGRERSRRRDRSSARESRSRDDERDRQRSASVERADGDDPVSAALSQIGDEERALAATPRAQSDEEGGELLPEELTTSQVSRTMRRYQRRLAECRQASSLPAGEVLRVDVALTVTSDGRVASARADSSDDAAGCVEAVVRDMRFGPFSGEPMSFTYPFRIR